LDCKLQTKQGRDENPELKRAIADGVLQEAGNRSVEQLAREENKLLVGLLRLRAHDVNGTSSGTAR
jgi:hypothetical protein